MYQLVLWITLALPNFSVLNVWWDPTGANHLWDGYSYNGLPRSVLPVVFEKPTVLSTKVTVPGFPDLTTCQGYLNGQQQIGSAAWQPFPLIITDATGSQYAVAYTITRTACVPGP